MMNGGNDGALTPDLFRDRQGAYICYGRSRGNLTSFPKLEKDSWRQPVSYCESVELVTVAEQDRAMTI